MNKRLVSINLVLLFFLSAILVPSANADYDSDGITDDADIDDDGDGVADIGDSCPTGTLDWISNETSDYDGDGCKDRSVLIDFYDTEDWTYQEFTFTITAGQSFDIYHECAPNCRYETKITMEKPDGNSVFWGSYFIEDEREKTFPFYAESRGRLSQIFGMLGDVVYGDNSITNSWNQAGTYSINITDYNQDYYNDGYDVDNGGVSLFVYLVGSEDAEDIDDDGDGVVDSLDLCMLGERNWISTESTDADGDGCRDLDEDDDDDNDLWGDHMDPCTNYQTSPVDGVGVREYLLSDSFNESNSEIEPAIGHGTPVFEDLNGESALYLGGYDAVEFPNSLTDGLNHSERVQFSFDFNLNDSYFNNSHLTAGNSSPDYQGQPGDGIRILISNQLAGFGNLGYSLWVKSDVDDARNYGLSMQITQPGIGNHFLNPMLNRNLSFEKWYTLTITYDFALENPTIEVLLNSQRYVYSLGPKIDDIECIKAHLIETPVRIGSDLTGSKFGTEEVNSEGVFGKVNSTPSIGMYVRNFSASSPVPWGSSIEMNSALNALIEHMNGNITLDEIGIDGNLEKVVSNLYVPWSDIGVNAVRYIDTYAATQGAIFDAGEIKWTPSTDHPLRYIGFTMQVYILESVFTSENILQSEGIDFPDAKYFPGLVGENAVRVADGKAMIRGTYQTDPARSFGDDKRLIQPTGFFAPAGEIVTIEVAGEHTDGGLVAWVGAHQADLRVVTDGAYARFPKVGMSFPIDSATTHVANPFGGSIYIMTPDGAQEGDLEVTISGAVSSPLFSTRELSQTTYEEWKIAVESRDAPWGDIASDRFMASFPLKHLEYSRDLLCSFDGTPGTFSYQSCTFSVPEGENITLEPAVGHHDEEVTIKITYPGSTTITYDLDTLYENSAQGEGDPEPEWHTSGSGVFSKVSNQSGEYKVELISSEGNGGATFYGAVMNYSKVYNPTELLEVWDGAIDSYLVLGGWPLERGDAQQHMWLLPDIQTPAAGTVAPAENPMSMAADVNSIRESTMASRRDLSWWADPRFVVEEVFNKGIMTVWHEWGHMHNIPSLLGEGESTVNVPAAIILNTIFNQSLDDSLANATFQGFNRSETAIDWMVTSNFRNGERIGEGYKGYTAEGYPLDQVSYQARGIGRYIDMAYLYGWDSVGGTHNVFYQRIVDGSTKLSEIGVTSDSDFTKTSSQVIGANMAPFFEFWGLEVDQEILDELNLMPRSEPVKSLLLEYREILPRNIEEFTEWHDSTESRMGAWQGPQVTSYLATYNNSTGQAGLDRIDTILCLYFEVNCANVPGVIPNPAPVENDPPSDDNDASNEENETSSDDNETSTGDNETTSDGNESIAGNSTDPDNETTTPDNNSTINNGDGDTGVAKDSARESNSETSLIISASIILIVIAILITTQLKRKKNLTPEIEEE
jgi:hypothetical protein